jgi:prepilin-type N-terminal cleavage/methylation domain-containing protein
MIGAVLVLWILRFVSKRNDTKTKEDIAHLSEAIHQHDEKGFTLIELMIVMTIIGVLAAIAIPQFSSYRVRAFDADAISALRTASLAQEAYYTDYQTYASEGSSSVIEALSDDVVLVIAVIGETYLMSASHKNSPNQYIMEGPGGLIEFVPGSP